MKRFANILLASILFGLGSCEDHLDINQSPNESPTSTMELTLPVAQAGIAIMINLELVELTGFLNQYWTQALQVGNISRYDRYTFDGVDVVRAWDIGFSGVLNDLKFVHRQAQATNRKNYEAISAILISYTYQVIIDIWDKAPIYEALQGKEGNLIPSFDDGPIVYDSIAVLLDRAVDIMDEKSLRPQQDDLIFNGDMNAWKRFANTLKLRILMRQAIKRPEVTSNGLKRLVGEGAEFLKSGEDVFIPFDGSTFNQNPLFRAYFAPPLNGFGFNASETVISRFQSSLDPRINFYFDAATTGPNTGNHLGIQQGFGALVSDLSSPVTDHSTVSASFVATPTAPVYLMTGFESLLLQAEAVERGLMPGSAQDLYNQGVIAAFDFAGYPKDALSFITAGGSYEYPNGTESERLFAIGIQKWMAMCQVLNVESWAETRRNDYFDFDQSLAGEGASLNGSKFPERALYPPSEIAANPNAEPNGNIGDPVWWRNK